MAVLVLVLLLLGAGCAPASAERLASWTLERENEQPETITLPVHLAPPAKATDAAAFTLRARVTIPTAMRGAPLDLVLPRLDAPVTLQVNGAPVPPRLGLPSGTYRDPLPHAWALPDLATQSESVELALTVHRGWIQGGWLDTVPMLAPRADAIAYVRELELCASTSAIAATACLGTIGLVYGVGFLLGRRQRALGWFAAQAITACLYCLFATGATARAGPGDVVAVSFGLTAAIVASVHFVHEQLRLGAPSRGWLLLLGLALVAVVARGGPYDVHRGPTQVTVLAIALGTLYQGWILVRRSREPSYRFEALTYLACWLALAATAWVDCVAWLGFGEPFGGVRLAPVGLALFALLQGSAFSHGFLASLHTADALNARLAAQLDELRAREREVVQLNGALQHQIVKYTGELSRALASLARSSGREVVLGVGDVVHERYRVVSVVGRGGMGTVYAVIREEDARPLALKVLAGAPDPSSAARLAREAQLAASVRHPNVVHVVDADVAPEGYLYVVMELVDGQALSSCRKRYRDVRWAIAVLEGVAAGLVAIHERGIVHRDLKPANVLVDVRAELPSTIKITDFGVSVARVAGSVPPSAPGNGASRAAGLAVTSDPTLTKAGEILGTPAYLAPEGFLHAGGTAPSSDVYSFGVIAFELLTGERPLTPEASLARALGEELAVPSLRAVRPDIDDALVRLVDAALCRDATRRPTAAECVDVLRALRPASPTGQPQRRAP